MIHKQKTKVRLQLNLKKLKEAKYSPRTARKFYRLVRRSEKNNQKASLLYSEIDNNPLFRGPVAKEDRSNMNVTFLLNDETKMEAFDKMWKEAGIVGLPGHRSAGGYRASMYNALPLSSVEVLVDVMREFGRKNG